ncbi:30S ribosomal protein S3 [Deinococcus peraridilitoris]|uniref:Small ribosomal subunit protein uS3 n=1 Tax=Deinococcus peraridilitoris (strain DSM 19664 / LMG 22246 / CIP 109416 / KR-200) TaxID=937777 RepID=L0A5N5_DEIPD|nr:30S ribosomal protein S3 [Deinococcus peraridilitoris]AFZ68492.1 ribosomal protein S3, bacterial type [Deinococcus peraridilitoris DSM 19664]
MGNKINPNGFRLGITKDWNSRWYASKKNYSTLILEDEKIRNLVQKQLKAAGIARIEIERAGQQVNVIISAAKPGIVIGKGGDSIKRLRQDIERLVSAGTVAVNVAEIPNPNTSAPLVALRIAEQIERRFAFRRAMKQAAQRVMESGARGVRIVLSGRLGGAEQARTEKVLEGRVPLHTLRADIDYGTALARTTYGILGVKVMVFNGEIIGGKTETVQRPPRGDRPRRDEGGDRSNRRRPQARRRSGGAE